MSYSTRRGSMSCTCYRSHACSLYYLDHGALGELAASSCQSNFPINMTAGDSWTEAELTGTSGICATTVVGNDAAANKTTNAAVAAVSILLQRGRCITDFMLNCLLVEDTMPNGWCADSQVVASCTPNPVAARVGDNSRSCRHGRTWIFGKVMVPKLHADLLLTAQKLRAQRNCRLNEHVNRQRHQPLRRLRTALRRCDQFRCQCSVSVLYSSFDTMASDEEATGTNSVRYCRLRP